MCVLDFGVVSSDQFEFMALFFGEGLFNLWNGPGFIFESC